MPQKCKRVCKPGSVLDGHQSTRAIANALQPPPENGRAGLVFSRGVAPDRVYSIGQSPADGWALTSPFHPYCRWIRLRTRRQRFISVALFLKSPSAGVTRYPCPAEPGLSSWRGFRRRHATVCLTHFYFTGENRACQREKSPEDQLARAGTLYNSPVFGAE